MAGKNQITGGAFQDFEGNVLAYGHLTMQLSHDGQESVDPGQVVGGLPVVIPLDQLGNIAGTVLIWPNDQLVPANSFYIVNAFRRDGQIAWLSPQNFAIPSAPSPYNIGAAIPTLPPVPGVGGATGVTLQTNEVNNGSQALLDLHAGSSIVLTDNGLGRVTVASAVTPLTLEVNGTPNASQSILNLQAGTGISITDNGAGNVGLAFSGSTLPSAQTGDTLRFNEYGDGAYDAVNALPQGFVRLYVDPANIGVNGQNTSLSVSLIGTASRLPGTTTDAPMQRQACSAVGSLSTSNGYTWGVTAGAALIALGIIRRLTTRLRMNNTTNVRYWIGLGPSTASYGTSVFPTDTPNANYIAFRFSSGTDSTIKAACGTATASQTIVDTGVAVDTTNTQLFDIAYNGTNAFFYINGVLKANISTNLPASSNLMSVVAIADNKNTANVNSLDFEFLNLSYK